MAFPFGRAGDAEIGVTSKFGKLVAKLFLNCRNTFDRHSTSSLKDFGRHFRRSIQIVLAGGSLVKVANPLYVVVCEEFRVDADEPIAILI